MHKFKTFFANHWQLFFWPLFASLLFIPTCGTYTVLPSPDSAPFYPRTYVMDRLVNLLAESPSVSLDDILELLLPPLFRHDFSYWLSVVATALGGYWFMRERNAPKTASAFAGGAFAFAGYSFTLISAGHRAYFTMTPYVVATFAFLVHAVRREDLLAYALAAATAAWAFRFGPDVGPQFLVVAALYAIWLFASNAASRPIRERTRTFLIGVGCALVSFALVASPSLVHTLTTTLAWRQKQIEDSSGTALTATGGEAEVAAKKTESEAGSEAADSAAKKDDEAVKAQEQWIFATNWSLPPEETIEFVAPGIFGTWTGDRSHPYWGRLGRSAGWDAAHPDRGGFFNFRQHIVYLGAMPLALALFAVAACFSARRKSATDAAEGQSIYLADVPFWLAIAVVALLLAFGRHAPFYRFFYAIPYMSYLRAPVKFMRLVEFAVAILAGSGLAALMADNCKRNLRKGLGIAAAIAAAACAIYAMHVNASASTFAAILGRLGAPQLMRPMALHAVRALWHAILGFGLVAALAFVLAQGVLRGRTAAAILLVALAIDIAVATHPFMFTVDKSLSYKPNAITETVAAATQVTEVPTVTILGVQSLPEWFTDSLSLSGIRRQPYNDVDNNAFLARSNGNIAAMCRETGSQYLIIPVSLSRAIDRAAFDHVFFFSLGANGIAKVTTPNQNTLELLRAKKCLPYCSLNATWRTANETDWMAKMAAGGPLVIGKDIPCPNETAAPTHGTAKVLSRRYQKGRFFSEVETDSDTEDILLVLDRTAWNLQLWVDGEPAEAVSAGYAHYMGVHLKPGRHVVKIGKPLQWRVPVFSLAILMLVVFGGVVFARRQLKTND
jgi:hypothetical protein